MPNFPDHAQLANIGLIEAMYASYLKDSKSVDLSWRHFFEGIEFGSYLESGGNKLKVLGLVQAYRRQGHLLAHFNPLNGEENKVLELGFSKSEMGSLFPTLGFCKTDEAPLKEIIAALQRIYSSRIGFEYMGLDNPAMEEWIQKQIEPQLNLNLPIEEKRLALEYLSRSEMLETFLHTKYVGQTRFSLEGAETMIPMIAEMIDFGVNLGIEDWVIGMAHRGRLNVLTSILNKPYELIFEEFENDTVLSFTGNDDVKYHMGFNGQLMTRSGKSVSVELAANPSHLESVDPIVLGQVYGKQVLKKDTEKKKVAPLLIHGDASVAGQGVVYESMQLKNLPDYSVGGTIHLVVNNQIGYTTLPDEGRSTRYCTDIAKSFGAPVFHVNAEDPEGCLFVSKLAVQIRQQFHTDVFIDLVCYRKYGHNEGDEPSFTQPIQYEKIRSKKSIRQIYHDLLVQEGEKMADELEAKFKEKLAAALGTAQTAPKKQGAPAKMEKSSCETSVSLDILKKVTDGFCKIPETFHFHPKLQKWLEAKK
jgi:2-oxoglutarate dehydrogenase E1 component